MDKIERFRTTAVQIAVATTKAWFQNKVLGMTILLSMEKPQLTPHDMSRTERDPEGSTEASEVYLT